jgi:hypothetical protein
MPATIVVAVAIVVTVMMLRGAFLHPGLRRKGQQCRRRQDGYLEQLLQRSLRHGASFLTGSMEAAAVWKKPGNSASEGLAQPPPWSNERCSKDAYGV